VDHVISFKQIRRILKRYDIIEISSMGKGSHTVFAKKVGNGIISIPIPTDRDPPLICYIKQIRRKFNLNAADGVSDEEFYGR